MPLSLDDVPFGEVGEFNGFSFVGVFLKTRLFDNQSGLESSF
jgi:hypothetical protein